MEIRSMEQLNSYIMTQIENLCFGQSIETIEHDDLKEFARKVVETLPHYIYDVGASSTGKYHPEYSLGQYGLVRHMVATLRILNHILSLEQYTNRFTPRQKDLLRIAALFHDGMKSGTQSDYETNKHTKHEHPYLMAKAIMQMDTLPCDELEYIAQAISSHMGQWNKSGYSKFVLPKPNNEARELVHLADYLASRKDINMSFVNWTIPH